MGSSNAPLNTKQVGHPGTTLMAPHLAHPVPPIRRYFQYQSPIDSRADLWPNQAGSWFPGGAAPDQERVYAAPGKLDLNQWALSGDWRIDRGDAALKQANGRITYRFHARDLNLVMGPAAGRRSVRFRVLIDGRPPGAAHGIDVDDQGYGSVSEQRMYQLIRQPQPIVDRKFEIEFLDPGVEAFDFTFG
jgi:Thioredoxin like C-terminal domain